MADTIALTISANGTNIQGDSTVTSLSREHTIEVLSLEQTVKSAFERATLMATGRRIYVPLRFTKRVDKSTPLLREAQVRNQVVAGQFRWFRPDPAATGTTQHFFTLAFTQGRITSATLRLPDVLNPDTANLPPLEDIELVFNGVTWTHVPGSIAFEDTYSAHAG